MEAGRAAGGRDVVGAAPATASRSGDAMEIILVRHAEPEWVRDGLSIDDPPLTDHGHEQAALLARESQIEEVARFLTRRSGPEPALSVER